MPILRYFAEMNKLVLTCEHGGAQIPASYKKLFTRNLAVLKTHRALDIGALSVAQDLANNLKVSLNFSVVSRLVIDLNRFLDSKTLFSEFTGPLSNPEKTKIVKNYYTPHWNKVTRRVEQLTLKKDRVVHVAVHSMTDRLHGKVRPMQLALLYDSRRKQERAFANDWIAELRREFPDFKIARNNPYKGDGEGLTTSLRRRFAERQYLGIELEINQGFFKTLKTPKQRQDFSTKLGNSLQRALQGDK